MAACKLAGSLNDDGNATKDSSAPNNLPVDGAEWVDLFVREIMSATSLDNARARAARILEILEKSISAHAGAEAAQAFQKVSSCFYFKTGFLCMPVWISLLIASCVWILECSTLLSINNLIN